MCKSMCHKTSNSNGKVMGQSFDEQLYKYEVPRNKRHLLSKIDWLNKGVRAEATFKQAPRGMTLSIAWELTCLVQIFLDLIFWSDQHLFSFVLLFSFSKISHTMNHFHFPESWIASTIIISGYKSMTLFNFNQRYRKNQ